MQAYGSVYGSALLIKDIIWSLQLSCIRNL